jgi:cytoskeletal protein RodZ
LKKPKPKKDELLNQIFQEISDENGKINNSYQENKSQDYNKKISSSRKNIQSMIIGMIVILILFLFFYPNHKTNKIDHNDTREDISNIPKGNQLYKEQKHTELKTEKKEKLNTEAQSKRTAEIKTREDEKTNVQGKKVLTRQNPETERERAKEILMQQMQN